MKKSKFLLGIIVISLIISACHKEMHLKEETSTPVVSTFLDTSLHVTLSQYGWLNFSTIKDFQNTMDMLHNVYREPSDLDSFESNFNGYTSLRYYYERIDTDTSNGRTSPTVDSLINAQQILDCPDSWFAAVLSSDGYIQIGDYVYCYPLSLINDNKAYAVPKQYDNELYSGTKPWDIKDNFSFTVHFQPATPYPEEWGGSGSGGTWSPDPPSSIQEGAICNPPSNFSNFLGKDPPFHIGTGDFGMGDFPQYNNRPVRIKAYRWRLGAGIYSSIGICVKIQKKSGFMGWLEVDGLKMNKVAMAACTEGQINYLNSQSCQPQSFNVQTSPTWPGYQVTYKKEFKRTLQYGTMITIDCMADVVCDYLNFHFWAAYGGKTVERDRR